MIPTQVDFRPGQIVPGEMNVLDASAAEISLVVDAHHDIIVSLDPPAFPQEQSGLQETERNGKGVHQAHQPAIEWEQGQLVRLQRGAIEGVDCFQVDRTLGQHRDVVTFLEGFEHPDTHAVAAAGGLEARLHHENTFALNGLVHEILRPF